MKITKIDYFEKMAYVALRNNSSNIHEYSIPNKNANN